MDLRIYATSGSNPSTTLPYALTPANSPQIKPSLLPSYGNLKGSLNNREAIFKVHEALSSLKKPGRGHEGIQNGSTSTEIVSASTTQPSTQPQRHDISRATSSTVMRPLNTVGLNLGQASEASDLALGRVVAQRLAMAGKILITKSEAPNSLVMLSIDSLLSQSAPDFFRFYSHIAGTGEVSSLCFGMPDVTWQSHQIRNISCGDIYAFCALKRTIWDFFCTFLRRCQASAVFRVVVTVPACRVADDTVTAFRTTECNRASAPWRGHASPPTQKKHSTTEYLAAPTRKPSCKTLRGGLPRLQIPPTPLYQHPLAIPPAMAYRQDNQIMKTPSVIKIVVRIQENERSRFGQSYSENVLLSEVTAVDFFTWFARCTSHAYPPGPPELKFILKDALPEPKLARVQRGDEIKFQCMKVDIKPHFERAKAQMPELNEFAILVTG